MEVLKCTTRKLNINFLMSLFEKLGVKRESKNSALLIIENNRRILGYAESHEESDFIVRRAMNILF